MCNHPVSETPGINGGFPVVQGSRTPVRVILQVFRQTDDLEQTAARFPHLTREQIRGALDYYLAHPERVDADIERNRQTWLALTGESWPV
jgi:uncharacterized protein (DUF433 family)